MNGVLQRYGVELRESGTAAGYPTFTTVSTRMGGNRSPKNLIFASPDKPDIRFRNVVDNDIEIVTNADKVLVYDHPIGADGLRWRDLAVLVGRDEGYRRRARCQEGPLPAVEGRACPRIAPATAPV